MVKTKHRQNKFGLIGRDISYSFSRAYFSEKFAALGLEGYSYENFDLKSIEEFPSIVRNTEFLRGLNVTIPYKQAVIPYLDELDPIAAEIGAVNTIHLSPKGLIGYNSDAYGFRKSLETLLSKEDKYALILGTGGASKAIAFVLNEMGIAFKIVSRSPVNDQWSYKDLNDEILTQYTLVINCTPLGTFPNVDEKPNIPYSAIGKQHFLFDLIYNPEITSFLKIGISKGSRTLNGLQMLELQAEKAWEIWNVNNTN